MNGAITARRPLAGLVGLIAAMLAALLLVPASASADEPQDTIDALLEQVNQAASEAGIDASEILEANIDLQVENGQTVRVTVEDALLRIAGRSVLDSQNNGGFLGLPEMGVGGIFHAYTDISIEPFVAVPVANIPPEPDVTHYDVKESDYSPTTPLLPVVNPLLLTGALTGVGLPSEVTDLAPGLNDPILLIHGGGKLKSVQGDGWDLGFHGAGSYLLQSNLDTGERTTSDEDPWPVWLPFLTGNLLQPDDRIDFVGFAQVIQGQECISIGVTVLGRFTGVRTCIGIGTIIGDGVAQYDEGPLNFRTDLMPLWEEAAPEIKALVDAVDGVIEQIPVGDVLALLPLDQLDLPDEVTALLGGSSTSTSSSDPVTATVETVVETTQTVVKTTTSLVRGLLRR